PAGDLFGEARDRADGESPLGAVAHDAVAQGRFVLVGQVFGDAEGLVNHVAVAGPRLVGDAEDLVEVALVVLVRPRPGFFGVHACKPSRVILRRPARAAGPTVHGCERCWPAPAAAPKWFVPQMRVGLSCPRARLVWGYRS